MPRIALLRDSLNEVNTKFEQTPLSEPVMLNSVPKCGTHLLKNIVRMFVPVEQHYDKQFIQMPILRNHMAAFDERAPKLSWGHLLFDDHSAIALKNVRQILLVRDPHDWVLARARFFLSDTFQGSLEHLKGGNCSIDEVLNMMIFGIHEKAPTLEEIFRHNAVAWIGTKAVVYRYEDILRHVKNLETPEAEEFFAGLLGDCGIEMPQDWRQRVSIGSDRKQSGTARENLKGQAAEIPEELPEIQKQLVAWAAPGLRKILGYE